jgi:hypothetical protein
MVPQDHVSRNYLHLQFNDIFEPLSVLLRSLFSNAFIYNQINLPTIADDEVWGHASSPTRSLVCLVVSIKTGKIQVEDREKPYQTITVQNP